MAALGWGATGLAMLAAGVAGSGALRLADWRADQKLRAVLLAASAPVVPPFVPEMLSDLPEPAQRFYRFVLQPGTALRTTALIRMGGKLGLGAKERPKFQQMKATQILAPPHGFLWQMRLAGPPWVTLSDAYGPEKSWSKLWLLGLLPLGRVSGNLDHRRSAFGRMVGEAVFWVPAAFLPAAKAGWDSLVWKALDHNTAEVTVCHQGLCQSVALSVDDNGCPLRVVFPRWSNENPDHIYRAQPFGGDLSDIALSGGVRVPMQVTGGNHFGTAQYHPFYRAKLDSIRFV